MTTSSMKRRIERLEQTKGRGFKAVMLEFFDADGQRHISRFPENISWAEFDDLRIERKPKEEVGHFYRRAMRTADEHFKGCFVLCPVVANL